VLDLAQEAKDLFRSSQIETKRLFLGLTLEIKDKKLNFRYVKNHGLGAWFSKGFADEARQKNSF
jgi:hypothetical protein